MPISVPPKITVPFATSGLKNAIPANTNNVTGNAGYDAGFGAINMTPKTAGGIPPFGQDFNGIFYDVTLALQFLEAGGSFPYDSAFATAVGGYPIGAVVSRSDSSGLWRNTVANNTTNPETFGAGWQPEDAGSTAVAMTNANITLTALQAARSIIIITGVLTANLNLILPTYSKQWLVVNNGTGAFTVTAKTASGSGVAVNTGMTQVVYGDGTNINQYRAPGSLIGAQTFLTSGTYTPTQGMTTCIIRVLGGGGGGGGAPITAAGNVGLGAGGHAGAYAEGRFTAAQIGGSQVVTIGSAGAGSTGTGGTGGATSLGALLTANGGIGGGSAGNAAPPISNGNGGSPASSSGGYLNAAGQIAPIGVAFSTAVGYSGAGAPTAYGSGGGAPNSTSNGANGQGFGSGGSGAYAAPSNASVRTGGNGTAGFLTILEYA